MENRGDKSDKEQYVATKYARERLMVSRTKAYEIVKEIEDEYAPEAAVRIGRSLRVRKDVFCRWVEDQVPGVRKPTPTSSPGGRVRSGAHTWPGEVGPSFRRWWALP